MVGHPGKPRRKDAVPTAMFVAMATSAAEYWRNRDGYGSGSAGRLRPRRRSGRAGSADNAPRRHGRAPTRAAPAARARPGARAGMRAGRHGAGPCGRAERNGAGAPRAPHDRDFDARSTVRSSKGTRMTARTLPPGRGKSEPSSLRARRAAGSKGGLERRRGPGPVGRAPERRRRPRGLCPVGCAPERRPRRDPLRPAGAPRSAVGAAVPFAR
jgi:hypothetical protein